MIITAIEYNNEAVRLHKDNKTSNALSKLHSALNSFEGTKNENIAEMQCPPLHSNSPRYIYDEGIGSFSDMIPISHDKRQDEDYVEAIINFNLGICYSLQHCFEIADDYFVGTHCIISSMKFSHSNIDKVLQSSLIHLNEGHNHYRAGNFEDALDAYWDAVNQAKREEQLDLRMATALNCIGTTILTSFLQEKDFIQISRALAPFNSALSVFVQYCGEDGIPDKGWTHLYMATIVNNIGRIRFYCQDFKGALPFFKKAHLVRRSHYGENHPEVAISAFYMGLCLQHLGDEIQATKTFTSYVGIMMMETNLAYLGDFIDRLLYIFEIFQKDNNLVMADFFMKTTIQCKSILEQENQNIKKT